ncbi:MAG TPA: hypothetical protein VMX12_07340 [Acidimicrobiia bacterium]|nr:hypothetical protein [Acidimicrobiia bacterium]
MPAPTALTRRPTPSVGQVAVPPRARGPVAPRPAYGRPPPSRAGSRPRTDARLRSRPPSNGHFSRRLLVAVLVVATVGAGAWWVLIRGETPVAGNFVRHEQRFADAARAVPESADQVTDVKALRRWNTAVDTHLAEMDLAYAQMVQIQGRSSEEAARITKVAVATAAQVIDLIGDYRDEVNNGALSTADSAARAIETLLTKLDTQARAWKKL